MGCWIDGCAVHGVLVLVLGSGQGMLEDCSVEDGDVQCLDCGNGSREVFVVLLLVVAVLLVAVLLWWVCL